MAYRDETKLGKVLEDSVNQCGTQELSLVDQLKAKRAQLAKKRADELRKLDRHIQLLEGSDAESIVRAATEALYGGD
jgi:hypothetical protein